MKIERKKFFFYRIPVKKERRMAWSTIIIIGAKTRRTSWVTGSTNSAFIEKIAWTRGEAL
jgi:hypothetical protein